MFEFGVDFNGEFARGRVEVGGELIGNALLSLFDGLGDLREGFEFGGHKGL